MANRVALDIDGLRVSAPGYNVLTTGQTNLLYDSRWSQITPLMKGSVTTGGSSGRTVFYGKTFANQPLTVFYVRPNGSMSDVYQWQKFGAFVTFYSPSGFPTVGYRCRVLSDRFILYDHNMPQTTVDYIVWDYNL